MPCANPSQFIFWSNLAKTWKNAEMSYFAPLTCPARAPPSFAVCCWTCDPPTWKFSTLRKHNSTKYTKIGQNTAVTKSDKMVNQATFRKFQFPLVFHSMLFFIQHYFSFNVIYQRGSVADHGLFGAWNENGNFEQRKLIISCRPKSCYRREIEVFLSGEWFY